MNESLARAGEGVRAVLVVDGALGDHGVGIGQVFAFFASAGFS